LRPQGARVAAITTVYRTRIAASKETAAALVTLTIIVEKETSAVQEPCIAYTHAIAVEELSIAGRERLGIP
jgi:hypothetical protein